jgi:hypothetical protein
MERRIETDSKNGVLRKILGPKTQAVTDTWKTPNIIG